MSFDDTLIFPEKISFGAHGGPAWITEIVNTGGGLEYRNQPNSQQLHTFNVGHSARRAELFADVARFYWICRGRFAGFRYKDWADFKVSDWNGTGVFIQLSTNTYQCYKQYTYGSSTYNRKITKLYGTTSIVGGTTPTTNQNTGVVTSGSAPTGWSGTFHVPCRFDIDDAAFQIINKNVNGFIFGWDSIPIKEIRV